MGDDAFHQREKGYEAKFRLDEELRFRAQSRCNKLLGLWAAERMGLTKSEAEPYAKEVVISDMEEAGTEDVVRKVLKDFAERNVSITGDDIRQQMERLYPVALEEIENEAAGD